MTDFAIMLFSFVGQILAGSPTPVDINLLNKCLCVAKIVHLNDFNLKIHFSPHSVIEDV